MTTREEILKILTRAQGKYISGEELARKLSLSRNAIWRAVKSLQEEGYTIAAVTNRGYSLTASPDILTTTGITQYLLDGKGWDIEVYRSITSTNSVLKGMAEQGAPEGKILVAEEQTAGKGRMNRAFYSPAGTGIYLSILLRPKFSPEESLYITTAAAVAVAQAIESVSDRAAQIKWVNDVYLDGKKVCGILTEASFDMETKRLAYAVVGIGVNILEPQDGFPEELRPIITSVWNDKNYRPALRPRLAAEIIRRFWDFYADLTNKPFLREYQRRSFLNDKVVFVINGIIRRPARALEIDDEFRLHVRYDDGTEDFLQSGEVSVKPTGSKDSISS